MRLNFGQSRCKPADEDDLHSVAIQEMGNYHEYLKNQAPALRELETQMVRQHMFGNPFKLVSKDQKTSLFGADEIDEVFEESAENINQYQHGGGANNQTANPSSNNNNNNRPQAAAAATATPAAASANKARSVIGGPANRRRGGVKGPLSKRINYMKMFSSSSWLSSSNNGGGGTSPSGSNGAAGTGGTGSGGTSPSGGDSGAGGSIDSDIEILDDSAASVASGFSLDIPYNSAAAALEDNSMDSCSSNSGRDEYNQYNMSAADIGNLNDFADYQMQASGGVTEMELDAANDQLQQQPTASIVEEESKQDDEEGKEDEREVEAIVGQAASRVHTPPPPRSASASSAASSASASLVVTTTYYCDNYMDKTYGKLKTRCVEQIRRPGNEQTRLLELINDSPLTLKMRLFLIRELIYEASRFKRADLIHTMSRYSNALQELAKKTSTHNNKTAD